MVAMGRWRIQLHLGATGADGPLAICSLPAMGISRKGKRLLTIGDERYFWCSHGTDYGIAVVVVTEDAFVHGQRGQQLGFSVPYGELVVAHDTHWSGRSHTVVTPGVVRRAIDLAKRAAPPFTGRAGEPDLLLSEEDVRRASAETPRVRIEANLVRADADLAAVVDAMGAPANDPAPVYKVGVLMDRLLDIGHMSQLAPETEDALVEGWFQRHARTIERIVPSIQAAANAIAQTLTTPQPFPDSARERCYERRSALAAFLDLGNRAGLGDVLARVDTAAADTALRAERPTKFAPPGIPRSHWWWGVRLPF